MKDAQGHGSDGQGGQMATHQSKVDALRNTLGAFIHSDSGSGKIIPGAEHLLEHIKTDPELLLHFQHFA